VLAEELLPGELLHHRALARCHRLRNVVLGVAARFTIRVNVTTWVALHTADLVLVLVVVTRIGQADRGRVRPGLGDLGHGRDRTTVGNSGLDLSVVVGNT